jgi:hypothetical protein
VIVQDASSAQLNAVHAFAEGTGCGKLTSFFELSGLKEKGS